MAISDELTNQLIEQIGSDNIDKLSNFMSIQPKTALILLAVGTFVVLIWSLVWKGLALWKAAGKKHKIWFIIILIVNTVGILEILYIYLFSKIADEYNKQAGKSKPAGKRKK